MTKKILYVAVVPAAIALGAALSPACSQPRINCMTGHGGYAVTYKLKSGSGVAGTSCERKAEIIGLQKYNPSQSGDPTKQDLERAILAMRPHTVGGVADAVETANVQGVDLSHVDAIGDFDSVDPDDKDVCTVKKLTPSSIDAPEIDLGLECCTGDTCAEQVDCPYPATCVANACVQAAASVDYQISNVRVLVTTAYEGVVFTADLTLSDPRQGCSADYTLLGLYPLIGCSTDEDCDPLENPDAGRVTGSGINPDFRDNLRCDPDGQFCVLKAPPESLR